MARTKSVLGKGLSALIPKAVQREPLSRLESAEEGHKGVIAQVEIDKIIPNPYQPRMDFDQQALDELKRSIKEKGIIQPITVRRAKDGMYQLISGERRIRAAREAGFTHIPSYVIEVKRDEEMLELALIENLQREHLNPIEIAISYQRLIDECHFTHEQVSKTIGKDRTTVTNFIRLLKLSNPIQQSLRKGEISMGHARALINLPDEKTQMQVWKRIISEGLSVRKVEQIVREIGTQGTKKAKKVIRLHPATESTLQTIESKMRQILGTQVKIHFKSDGKGEIVIEYYSNDDLERILDLFSVIEKNV